MCEESNLDGWGCTSDSAPYHCDMGNWYVPCKDTKKKKCARPSPHVTLARVTARPTLYLPAQP